MKDDTLLSENENVIRLKEPCEHPGEKWADATAFDDYVSGIRVFVRIKE